jgi:hypothetical protein
MNEQTVTTNGHVTTTTTASKESALARFLKEVEGQKVNETDKKKTVEAFKRLAANREKAEAALKAAIKDEDKVSRDMIRCFGRKAINVDGIIYSPSSRDERIFYKRGASDIEQV